MSDNEPGMVQSFSRKGVLFICTGNTCRSPLAEAMLKKRIMGTALEERLNVSSAGLLASEGQPASSMSLEVAHSRGIELDMHRSRPLTRELIAAAELIVVMQKTHQIMLQKDISSQGKEIRLLGEFRDSGGDTPDIRDPFGGNRQTYEECFDEISRAVEGLFEYLSGSARKPAGDDSDAPGPVLN